MANTLAALLKTSNQILTQSFAAQTRIVVSKSQAIRSLYSQSTLGIDGYLLQKTRTISQLSNIAPKFREKMRDYTADDSKNMVFTEDLKNMLHLADNDEDVELLIKMMKRFNQQNKQLRFGNYVFGPVAMRMFYSLSKAEEAYQCFKDPQLEGLFDQLITYQILLDLLYEHQRYEDILEAFKIIKDKQIEGIKFAKNVIVLALAACYKINTKKSLEYALNLWKDLHEIGHLPMRRATTFCAALALNQGKPDVALEILSSARNVNYTTIRNIKVAALVAMGRIDDAIPILKSVLQEDSASIGPKQTFNRDVVDQVKAAVEKLNNSEDKLEFNRIEKYFQEQGHIAESTLDEQLCTEIATPPMLGRKINDNFVKPTYYNRNQRFDGTNRQNYRDREFNRPARPGLSDLQ